MQTGISTSATDHAAHNGAAVQTLNASGPVLPSTDFNKAIGGSGGIVLTLTGTTYATGDPTNPVFLGTVYHAVRIDAGAGIVSFVDASAALFNGQSSWVLANKWQWAIFIWDGVGWTCMGN
jgi:hypothetical protein